MRGRVAAWTVVMIVVGCCGVARAQNDAREQRRAIQREIDGLDHQIHNLQRIMDQTSDQLRDLTSQLDRVRNEATQQAATLREANQEVESAMAPFKAAKDKTEQTDKALKDLTKALRVKMESSDEVQAARKTMDEQQEARRTARMAALEPLMSHPDYIAACEAQKSARESLDQLKSAPTPDRAAISQGGAELLEKQKVVDGMEQSVLSGDKNYREANASYVAASKAYSALMASIPDRVKADPQRVAAAAVLDDARTEQARLQAPLSAALQRQSSARAAVVNAQDRAQRTADQIAGLKRDYDVQQRQLWNMMARRDQLVRALNDPG